MMYRFNILTNDGWFEGWAHNKEEMVEKFKNARPDLDCEVLLFGPIYENISLDIYRKIQAEFTNEKIGAIVLHAVDDAVGRLVDEALDRKIQRIAESVAK